MKSFVISLVAIIVLLSVRAGSQQPALIAWYPLNGTANDTTGKYQPMTLTNTPFQPGGGILCNGVYSGSGLPDRCDAETPPLPLSIFQGFTVTVEYKTQSFTAGIMPVFVGGPGWRWMSINQVWDGAVELQYNNGYAVRSTKQYAFDAWHQAALTYDSATAAGRLYIDGELACAASFTILHGPNQYDRIFSISNGGSGTTYKGVLRNVRFYAGPNGPVGLDEFPAAMPSTSLVLSTYPEPSSANTRIAFVLPKAAHAVISITDILGKQTEVVLDGHRQAGAHTIDWNATHLTAGLYLVRLATPSAHTVTLLTIVR